MANLSDAFGTIRFIFNQPIAQHAEQVNAFISALAKDWGDGEYNTYFTQLDCKDVNPTDFCDSDYSVCLDISGTGRWEYSNNCSWYFSNDKQYKCSVLNFLPLLSSDIQLESIEMDYTDTEIGNRIYIESTVFAEIDYSENEPSVNYAIDEHENRNLTKEDMLNLGYDEEDLVDYGFDDDE